MIAIACLAYHWARAKWRASGEPARFGSRGVVAFLRIVREGVATVPFVSRGVRRRRRAADAER